MNLYSFLLSFKQWAKEWGLPLLSGLSTYGLLWIAQPPNDCPEAAFVFLFPALLWLSSKPRFSKVFWVFGLSGLIYHICLIGWMRHITLEGMLLASCLLSVYYLPWFLLARRFILHGLSQSFGKRLIFLICLPALWVSIEWLRCQFTLGFPWCPLSVTQWERPMILQSVAWCGSWCVSFFLVTFNLCICSYLHHLLVRRRQRDGGFLSSLCPDFYYGICLFCLIVSPFFLKQNSKASIDDSSDLKVGVCQPYLKDKWQKENATMHKDILKKQTRLLSEMEPDLIVWPEASTPYALNLDGQWIEALVDDCGVPLFLGSVVRLGGNSYNTVSRVLPQSGIDSQWYAKRILVPFGEYVPFPFRWIPGLRRLVGPVGNFTSGESFVSLDLSLENGSNLKVAPLICYEDIFPALSKGAVQHKSDLLFVTTNDAWFGEEGCAEQHAAHSVMRAVESGLPVLRCGNAGWSGWIDPFGRKQDVLLDEEGSVYFQGAGIVEISTAWNRKTFYSQNIDFFAYFCLIASGLLLIHSFLICIWLRKRN